MGPSCMLTAGRIAATHVQVIVNLLLPAITYTSQLQLAAADVYTFYGINMHLDIVLSADIGSVALTEVKQAGSVLASWHDGWFVEPQYFSDLHNAGGMASLDALIEEQRERGEDTGIVWEDVLPAVRDHILHYNGELVGFPMSGDMLMLFYRKDLLALVGEGVPSTWEQVLAISRKLRERDVDTDGKPEYGMCFNIMPGAPGCQQLNNSVARL
jgi:hypothetical protein